MTVSSLLARRPTWCSIRAWAIEQGAAAIIGPLDLEAGPVDPVLFVLPHRGLGDLLGVDHREAVVVLALEERAGGVEAAGGALGDPELAGGLLIAGAQGAALG